MVGPLPPPPRLSGRKKRFFFAASLTWLLASQLDGSARLTGPVGVLEMTYSVMQSGGNSWKIGTFLGAMTSEIMISS